MPTRNFYILLSLKHYYLCLMILFTWKQASSFTFVIFCMYTMPQPCSSIIAPGKSVNVALITHNSSFSSSNCGFFSKQGLSASRIMTSFELAPREPYIMSLVFVGRNVSNNYARIFLLNLKYPALICTYANRLLWLKYWHFIECFRNTGN